jgi:hypothetical protein
VSAPPVFYLTGASKLRCIHGTASRRCSHTQLSHVKCYAPNCHGMSLPHVLCQRVYPPQPPMQNPSLACSQRWPEPAITANTPIHSRLQHCLLHRLYELIAGLRPLKCSKRHIRSP